MDTLKEECEISDEDLAGALKEMGTYVDVTEGDLKKIYSIARERKRPMIGPRRVQTSQINTVGW